MQLNAVDHVLLQVADVDIHCSRARVRLRQDIKVEVGRLHTAQCYLSVCRDEQVWATRAHLENQTSVRFVLVEEIANSGSSYLGAHLNRLRRGRLHGRHNQQPRVVHSASSHI